MRNLKKILALVLALMMVLSVMVFASAANYDDYSDKDQVSEEYAEAVEVLTGMDIFWGSENSFYPKSNVSRAEVATLLYRVMTTDVSGSQVGIYADYGMFDDVLETNWFAGYVNYSANNEYVVGVGDNNYNPKGNVTGYEWITMLLRAIGYDANGEISGSDWKITAAGLAKKAGILEGFNEATLNSALTREQVAYLLFNAIQASQVYYTPALNYYIDDLPSIGVENFDLASTKLTSVDEWGRPGYYWYADVDADAAKEAGEATYATIEEAPVKTYNTAVTECDVADDTTDRDTTYALYVNGKISRGNYMVNALDTVTKIGAQGRLTEVYADRIVMIDTFLANVVSVADAAYDAAGHLKTPATITLAVYDGTANGNTYILTNGTTNYTYTAGQMVLLNAYTTTGTHNTSGNVTKQAATNYGVYGEILSVSSSVVGAQTIIYTNADQHNVNGTVYNDALKFILDEAGVDTANHTWYFDQYNNLIGVTDIAAATSYGVINSIWWAGNTTDGSGVANATVTYMDGTTGTVTIGSMTVNTATVGSAYVAATGRPTYSIATADIMSVNAATNQFWVTTDAATNERAEANTGTYTGATNGIIEDHLFRFTTQANGTMAATEVGGTTSDTVAQLASANTAMSKDNITAVVASNSTLFLIRNADGSFTSITGINNIGSYNTAEVDYVDLNNDGVAEYVYIIGTPVNAVTDNLFYYAGGQISYNADTNVWTIPGYVDGNASNIYVYDTAGTGAVATNVTYTTLVQPIITGGVHKLYNVTITNGYMTAINNGGAAYNTASTGAAIGTMDNNSAYAAYGNGTNVYVTTISGATGDSYGVVGANMYRDAGGYTYLTNASTKLYGTWTSDMSGKDVIVVWTGGTTNGLVLQAYVVDKSSVVTPVVVNTTSVSVVAPGAVLNGNVNAVTFNATGNSGAVALNATAVWQVREFGSTEFRNCTANEVFVSGNTYRAVITISVPAATSSYVTIASTNTISYVAGATTLSTGTGTTVVTDAFLMS